MEIENRGPATPVEGKRVLVVSLLIGSRNGLKIAKTSANFSLKRAFSRCVQPVFGAEQMTRVESLNKAAELDALLREWSFQSLFQDDVTSQKIGARVLAVSAHTSICRRFHA